MDILRDHFAGVTVDLQQCTVLDKTARVSNPDRGWYAAFAGQRGRVLKNRAFLDYESSHSGEQGREMWMQDPNHKDSTCGDSHDIFGLADHMRLPAGSPRCGA